MGNVILDKSFRFSLKIIELYKAMKSENEFIISKQVLRCGTSIGSNVSESVAAQTKKDFIAKMSIASKEARETKYWLMLLKESKFINYDFSELLNDVEEIIKILTSIVKTSQNKINK